MRCPGLGRGGWSAGRRMVAGITIALAVSIGTLAPGSVAAASPSPAVQPCPPDADLSAIRAVPEDQRAACFGRQPLVFEAWGFTVMNTWPGVRVPDDLRAGDFGLSETDGPDALWVFLPPHVSLPDPEGTRWENLDGIPPGAAWFRVTGHFDDPLAEACVPEGGDTMDGVPVVKAPDEVVAFCRNHFVIDGLEWLPAGPGGTAGHPATSVPPDPADASDAGDIQDWALIAIVLVAGGLVLAATAALGLRRRRRPL